MQFFMLIPNMTLLLTKRLIVMDKIAEYWQKNVVFAYPEQIDLDFGHVHSFISKQIIYEFVAREKFYRMV